MKQTIEIEVPDGKKAIWKDGKIIFEDIAPKLPETWEEFCKLYPVKEGESYINIHSNIVVLTNGKRIINDYQNVLPSQEAAKAHLVLMQLHQLRDCYNNNWHCNWTDENETNAVITRSHGKLTVYADWAITTFLTFKSKEIAEKFLNNFKDLIEQAGDLI